QFGVARVEHGRGAVGLLLDQVDDGVFDRHQKDSWFRERCLSARRSRARALSSPRASLGVEEMKIEAQPILLSFKWPPAERSTLQPSA
ncbi:hypothetical protein KX844_32235, partial [Pseudomonas aeruginosa]|nr:hypothetical protein [Pseudomonas aeruginosa]